MVNKILMQEINRYDTSTLSNLKNALREVGQRIVLSGLTRSGIFEHCAFYGGTSLRILHNLDRFSESLDFTLVHDCHLLPFEYYLSNAAKELTAYGIPATYETRIKKVETSVISGYIKFNLKQAMINIFDKEIFKVNNEENLSIKVEVETNFYSGFNVEYKIVLFPSFSKVKTFDLSTLFSCKILAILNRKWKARVKGRDYFDFLFYIKNQVTPNYNFLKSALNIEVMNKEILSSMLLNKFEEVDFNSAYQDVEPFIDNKDGVKSLFNKELFIELVNEIK